MVLDGKSSQEYPVNAGVPQGSILGPTLFLLYINYFPDDVISNIDIYDADDTNLYSNCDLWLQLDLASELESDLWDTVDWNRMSNSVKERVVCIKIINKSIGPCQSRQLVFRVIGYLKKVDKGYNDKFLSSVPVLLG